MWTNCNTRTQENTIMVRYSTVNIDTRTVMKFFWSFFGMNIDNSSSNEFILQVSRERIWLGYIHWGWFVQWMLYIPGEYKRCINQDRRIVFFSSEWNSTSHNFSSFVSTTASQLINRNNCLHSLKATVLLNPILVTGICRLGYNFGIIHWDTFIHEFSRRLIYSIQYFPRYTPKLNLQEPGSI